MFPRSAAFTGLLLSVQALVLGCGDQGSNAPGAAGDTPTTIKAFVPDASDAATLPDTPQAEGMAATYQGSALCRASLLTGCYPDDTVNACALGIDGGASASDAEPDDAAALGELGEATACHVIETSFGPSTACFSAGLGLTNASCSTSADCAAGHECVGAGSCRHYCCGGTSACQINEFCDVQPMAQDPQVLVPVCMPELPCTLLGTGVCPANQQCSVVREDGTTSCVNVGTAQDRQPCDVEHCALGLVCIGAQNQATCAPLCSTSGPDACAATGRTCTATLPLFQDRAVGVCQ